MNVKNANQFTSGNVPFKKFGDRKFDSHISFNLIPSLSDAHRVYYVYARQTLAHVIKPCTCNLEPFPFNKNKRGIVHSLQKQYTIKSINHTSKSVHNRAQLNFPIRCIMCIANLFTVCPTIQNAHRGKQSSKGNKNSTICLGTEILCNMLGIQTASENNIQWYIY